MRFDSYQTDGFYDEMFTPEGRPREEADLLVERIQSLPEGELRRRHQAAERRVVSRTVREQKELVVGVKGDDVARAKARLAERQKAPVREHERDEVLPEERIREAALLFDG